MAPDNFPLMCAAHGGLDSLLGGVNVDWSRTEVV
jgi:hypothetical protein